MKSTASATPAILLLLGFLILLAGCGSKKKSDEIKNYKYDPGTAVMNPQLQAKLGSWVKEGTVCYAVVITINKDKVMLDGIPVKAKVVTIRSDSIKMKALEAVTLADIPECTKLGLVKGESWWEKDGDLFKTKEEAENWLKDRGILKQ